MPAMGYSAAAGWRSSAEYDYIHQDELRSGTQSVPRCRDGNELERDTLNRYITRGSSYSPNAGLEYHSVRALRRADSLHLRRI